MSAGAQSHLLFHSYKYGYLGSCCCDHISIGKKHNSGIKPGSAHLVQKKGHRDYSFCTENLAQIERNILKQKAT
jgi:hypothetical protein